MRCQGILQIVDHASLLQAQGLYGGEHAFGEAATRFAVTAEGTPPPQHRGTQGPFGGIVRRLDPLMTHKSPQRRFPRCQIAAQCRRRRAVALDPASQQVVIEWESDGHNGGELGFGPDGMLYIPAGDGTSDSDKNLRGQDLRYLTSSMIRIDVDHPEGGKNYSVPKDNPFLDLPYARPEIWAYGFRNPWRMAFDHKTGLLWVGQNGQDLWESAMRELVG